MDNDSRHRAPTGWLRPGPEIHRAVARTWAESVVVVTGRSVAGQPLGFTVSSFTSVSLDPPLVLFCVGHRSRSWAGMAPTGRFAINLLGADQSEVADRFAGRGDPSGDLDREQFADGSPLLPDASGTVVCRLLTVHPAGDHDIVIGRIEHARLIRRVPPLVYHQADYTTVTSPVPHRGALDAS